MIDLEKLKGVNFTKKYYDPSKPFSIKTDFYEFHSKPSGRYLEYEFISKWYNIKSSYGSRGIYTILKRETEIMCLNKYRISLIEELFSNCDDVDFIQLFFDLTENDELRSLYYYADEDSDKLVLAYKDILRKYNIKSVDESLINQLIHIIRGRSIQHQATCNYYDYDNLFNKSIEDPINASFKLAYIIYLQLVNSAHKNSMDKSHYFDDKEIEDLYNLYHFYQIDEKFPIDVIKKIAIKNNHMIDGKGLGVLKFRTTISELKEVLGKYNLKKYGNKTILIDRILDNLSEEEINNEFNGSRFILTEEGRNFLNKYKDYDFKYFQVLPPNFKSTELDLLCRENPNYKLEDIIYSIVMHDWCKIENPNMFSKDYLKGLTIEINRNRFFLANFFKNQFPERSIKIYSTCIREQLDFSYLDELLNLYEKYNMQKEELDLLEFLMDKLKKDIENNTPKFDEIKFEKNVSKILELLDKLIEINDEEKYLKILKDLKKEYTLISEKSVYFIRYHRDSYYFEEFEQLFFDESLDDLVFNGAEIMGEITSLEGELVSMFFNWDLDELCCDLDKIQKKYDIVSK